MKVNLSNVSFRAYAPVRIFVKNTKNGPYCPVANPSKVDTYGGHLTRNLNKTLKHLNYKFIDYYASYDKDYAKNPKVHAVYDKDTPNIYMVSGDDSEIIEEFGKPVGKAKRQSINYFKHADSYDSKIAARNYFYNVKKYLKSDCQKVKNFEGDPLILTAYFDTKYDKQGIQKGYEFKGAEFVRVLNNDPHKLPDLEMRPQEVKAVQLDFFNLIDN